MSDGDPAEGLRARITRQGEDALGKLAQELLENPLISGAIGRALDAREKAAHAQEAAMGALNLPSAADLERLTRRVRSVSQRLEGIEEALDRVQERVGEIGSAAGVPDRLLAIEADLERLARAVEKQGRPPRSTATDRRLAAIESQLASVVHELGLLRDRLPGAAEPVPREQERMRVGDAEA